MNNFSFYWQYFLFLYSNHLKIILKSLIYIGLIFSFILNSFGYIILFEQQRFEAGLEMRERIASSFLLDELTLITVDKKNDTPNLNWKDDNEFELNGKMFDVVKKSESSDSIFIYYINDIKEESIVKNLLKYYDDLANRKQNSPAQKRILHNIINFALLNNAVSVVRRDKIISDYFAERELYDSMKLPIPTPPPINLS